MLIAITGGSGTLALNLAQNLATEGHKVRLLSSSKKDTQILLDNVEHQRCDYSCYESLMKCLDGVEAIINSAGPNSLNCHNHFETEGILGIKTAENISKACLNQAIPLIINFSTFHVYEHNNVKVYNESSDLNYSNLYGLTNLISELVFEKNINKEANKLINLRLTNVVAFPAKFKKNYPMLLLPDICRQCIINGRIELSSRENVFRDYLPISVLSSALSKIVSGDLILPNHAITVNLAGGNVLNLKEIADVVAEEFECLFERKIEISYNFSDKSFRRFLIDPNIIYDGKPTMKILRKDIRKILKSFRKYN